MSTRREFLEVAAATALLTAGSGPLGRLAAQQAITGDQLLAFEPKGQVTLLHLTDLHAQLNPVYFREPSINLGVGPVAGLPPHVSGSAFLEHLASPPARSMPTCCRIRTFRTLRRITVGSAGWIASPP